MAKKKNKLDSLDQIDAKNVGVQNTLINLDALLGEDNSNPYKTFELSAYESYINELNSTDLHRHAQKIGLVPTVDRRVLKERLLREFKRFVASRGSIQVNSSFSESGQLSLSSEAQKILREGS